MTVDEHNDNTTTVEQQSQLKLLIARGKEQGYLTYAEVNDHLPNDIVDPEQIEDIVNMINDMGITVYEKVPDADATPAFRCPGDQRRGSCGGSRRSPGYRGQRIWPHHRPGAHVHARDGHGRAAYPRGRNPHRQAHRGRPRSGQALRLLLPAVRQRHCPGLRAGEDRRIPPAGRAHWLRRPESAGRRAAGERPRGGGGRSRRRGQRGGRGTRTGSGRGRQAAEVDFPPPQEGPDGHRGARRGPQDLHEGAREADGRNHGAQARAEALRHALQSSARHGRSHPRPGAANHAALPCARPACPARTS